MDNFTLFIDKEQQKIDLARGRKVLSSLGILAAHIHSAAKHESLQWQGWGFELGARGLQLHRV